MDHLLFLAHRIPFPPDKGDKIRSYHLLKHLSRRYHVHLGSFVDDERDWQFVDTLKALCGETHFCALHRRAAQLRSLSGLLRGEALTLAFYRDAGMRAWAAALTQRLGITRFLVYSAAMAQFVPAQARGRRVIDFVDVDSDKWSQYARTASWPARLIYRREARCLFDYERTVAQDYDAALFVSQAEAALFQGLAPECAAKVDYLANGVDTDYFNPAQALADPYPAGSAPIVFTGAMDYRPNADAVVWFADAILPAIRARHPAASFHIVGSQPGPQVRALAARDGVVVTGRVPDVRPYVAHARVAVAPLRIARGVQNKVLEAMAMAKPVIVTAQALAGIDALPGRDLLLAGDAAQFAEQVSGQLTRPDRALGLAARQLVLERYGWAANLARVDRCFADTDAAAGELP